MFVKNLKGKQTFKKKLEGKNLLNEMLLFIQIFIQKISSGKIIVRLRNVVATR